jgi:hypothetical protein
VQWGSQWINPIRWVVLIKEILSTFHLYQCSTLLVSRIIMNQISMDILKFLCQGGRSNENKYHLINWKVVRNPKYRGELGIRDPVMLNVDMGEKMLLWEDDRG